MNKQSFPMPHDIFVGESIEAYQTRKGVRSVPFEVPLVRYNYANGTTAVIQAMDPWRVQGQLDFRWKSELGAEGDEFNVKHDGKKFSVGSGSGKHTFYFKNIGFVNKD